MSLLSLPAEIQLNILPCLDPNEFLNLTWTCRYFRDLRKLSPTLSRQNYLALEQKHSGRKREFHPQTLMLCYGCCELLTYEYARNHHHIPATSKFSESQERATERLCVPCDLKRGGVYLAKVKEERESRPLSCGIKTALLQGDLKEIMRLRETPAVMAEMETYGLKGCGKKRDVRKWGLLKFKTEFERILLGRDPNPSPRQGEVVTPEQNIAWDFGGRVARRRQQTGASRWRR
jgi:F-box-like